MQLLNAVRFNEGIVSTQDIGYSEISVSYTMKVYDKDGVLLAYLPNWVNGRLEQELNKPAVLEFEYPALDLNASLIQFPNQIWLFNQDDTLMNKFHILPVSMNDSQESAKLNISCESLLYQLSKELIIDYTTVVIPEDEEEETTETKSVLDILKDLFSLQVHSRKLYIGQISPLIANEMVSFQFEKGNILDALNKLFEIVDTGTFWVEPVARRLNWKLKRGYDKYQQIRLGKNMSGITINKDYSKLVNRIYVYGNDNGINGQVKLTDISGVSNEYLEDSTSIAQYGIQAAIEILKDVYSPDTLYKYAEAFLDLHSQPKFSYEIDFVNLHASNPIRYEFEGMALGSVIQVINEDHNVSTELNILKMESSLDNPLQMQITLGSKPVTIELVFSKILNRIATLEKETNLNEVGVEVIVNEILEEKQVTKKTNIGTQIENIVSTAEGGDYGGEYAKLVDAFELLADDLIGDIPELAEVNTLPISANSGSIGESPRYASETHTHKGAPFIKETTRSLMQTLAAAENNDEEGVVGYEETNEQLWVHDGSSFAKQVLIVEFVSALPAIPTDGLRVVYWNNQLWIAKSGDSRYYPMYKPSNESGVPA